jgi:sigma-B regulation protein RsbU (phosphoserine phosphatase)
MSGLIVNVLDFARGRLGGGFVTNRNADEPLKPILEQVASELMTTHPGRTVKMDFDFVDPINCDRARLAQLFSNLLANALTHGAADRPVFVTATTGDGFLTLSVANSGEPIPPTAIKQLFRPFTRGSRSYSQGLGLGLFIASEIARAHWGTLTVASTTDETRFTFRMPLQ